MIVTLALFLVGCSGSSGDDSSAASGTPTVVASFSVLADIVANVAGSAVTVESLVPAGSDVHSYEPTPGDVRRANDADLILTNGLGLEAGLSDLLSQSAAPVVEVTAGVSDLGIVENGAVNPHAWMSPTVAWIYVDNIVTALSNLDPEDAATFRTNGEAYKQQLYDAQNALIVGLAGVPVAQRVLVTCEGSLSYLARDNAMEARALWSNTGVEPTPGVMTETIDIVRQRAVPAVFCESTINDGPMRRVAAESGAAFGGILYADSLSGPDGPVPTYLDLLAHNADVILAGLGGAAAP
ncbi:metal ABC transporter solute-binding protein, Zn/Mn family [Millisia brevis]|uniref:metal ABC transporter solute-binding protein, Zn/Mn family n=1 Tax=Millisia brevis TaxID=264148 RepID=UPI001FE14337